MSAQFFTLRVNGMQMTTWKEQVWQSFSRSLNSSV